MTERDFERSRTMHDTSAEESTEREVTEEIPTPDSAELFKKLYELPLVESHILEDETINPEEVQHILAAEIRKLVESVIQTEISSLLGSKGDYNLEGPFMRELSSAIIKSHSPENAVESWLGINDRIQKDREKISITSRQLYILNLSKDVIEDIYNEVTKTLQQEVDSLEASNDNGKSTDSMIGTVLKRIVDTHHFNDKYELEQEEKEFRSLESLRKNGMTIHLGPRLHEGESPREARERVREVLKQAVADSDRSGIPVVELLKNERLLNVNRFSGSKLSQAVHDMADHYWTYDLMENQEIFDRYSSYFDAIGNPQDTDMFNREGEMVASIAYDWRASHFPERRFAQRFSTEDIKRKLVAYEKQEASEQEKDNLRQALEIVDNLLSNEDEKAQLNLEIIFNGMLVELMEQRRKHGYIKILDESGKPTRKMRLIEPQALAMIVEVANVLSDPAVSSDLQRDILNFELKLEMYLRAAAESPQKFTFKLDDLSALDPNDKTQNTLPDHITAWIKENPHHISTRKIQKNL